MIARYGSASCNARAAELEAKYASSQPRGRRVSKPPASVRLKLRPQFKTSADQRVIKIKLAPVYDHPATIDELFQDAAPNHELERAYHAQRTTAQAARRETLDEWRNQVALEFLGEVSVLKIKRLFDAAEYLTHSYDFDARAVARTHASEHRVGHRRALRVE